MAVWFWIVSWGLWWLIVALGTQGTSPVMGLIGVLSIPFLFRKLPSRPGPDVIALGLFVVWCVVGIFLNGQTDAKLLKINPATDTYSIESPGARLALSLGLAGLGLWRLHFVESRIQGRALLAARTGLGLVFLMVVLSVIGTEFFYGLLDSFSNAQDRLLNLLRSANLVVLTIPLTVAILPFRKPLVLMAFALVYWVAMFIVSRQLGTDAAMVALFVIAVFAGLIWLVGRWTYRILGYGTAVLLLVMPILLDRFIAFVRMHDVSMPASFFSRVDSYAYVLEKIQSKWLFGWGMQASKGWDDTRTYLYDGIEVQYRLVPGHPHNMALQAWAELGLVGVLLLCLFAILFGERLYRTAAPDRARLIVGGCLWAGALVYGLFSYSLWNDAFWMGVFFIGSGVLLVRKPEVVRAE